MKKVLLGSVMVFSVLTSQNALATISTNTINFSGHYKCQIYDIHDKALTDELEISMNEQNSRLSSGYGAYNYKSLAANGTIVYEGSMVTNGNNFAMTFNNTSTADPTDYGTIIGTATYDLDSNGIAHTVLHSFYYEPAYAGGNNGTGTCVKQ